MENLSAIGFYLMSFLLIISSFGVVLSCKISLSISWTLILSVIFGVLYFLLNAPLNAIVQILVSLFLYAFWFFISIFLNERCKEQNKLNPKYIISLILIFIFFAIVLNGLINNYFEQVFGTITVLNPLNKDFSTIYVLGENIVSNYFLAFEVLGLILFACIIWLYLNNTNNKKGEE